MSCPLESVKYQEGTRILAEMVKLYQTNVNSPDFRVIKHAYKHKRGHDFSQNEENLYKVCSQYSKVSLLQVCKKSIGFTNENRIVSANLQLLEDCKCPADLSKLTAKEIGKLYKLQVVVEFNDYIGYSTKDTKTLDCKKAFIELKADTKQKPTGTTGGYICVTTYPTQTNKFANYGYITNPGWICRYLPDPKVVPAETVFGN